MQCFTSLRLVWSVRKNKYCSRLRHVFLETVELLCSNVVCPNFSVAQQIRNALVSCECYAYLLTDNLLLSHQWLAFRQEKPSCQSLIYAWVQYLRCKTHLLNENHGVGSGRIIRSLDHTVATNGLEGVGQSRCNCQILHLSNTCKESLGYSCFRYKQTSSHNHNVYVLVKRN